MNTSKISRFTPIFIAEIKDNVLKYLIDNSKPEPSEKIYEELKLDIPNEYYSEYLREMGRADYIIVTEMTGSRKILKIKNKGRIFYDEGGYTKIAKDKLTGIKQMEEKDQIFREKTELEITNLKASIKNYASTKKRANLAIVISIISIIVTILIKIIFK